MNLVKSRTKITKYKRQPITIEGKYTVVWDNIYEKIALVIITGFYFWSMFLSFVDTFR